MAHDDAFERARHTDQYDSFMPPLEPLASLWELFHLYTIEVPFHPSTFVGPTVHCALLLNETCR